MVSARVSTMSCIPISFSRSESVDKTRSRTTRVGRVTSRGTSPTPLTWLQTFIESAGFNVVATYNPPETLSAGDITALLKTARTEDVALIVDNLQIDTEFGEGIASQVGAEHVVLTNFPDAIPNTETLSKMLRYNAEQLFDATVMWKSTSTLRVERNDLANQVTIFQITTSLAVVVVAVEAVLLYARRKKKQ